MMKFLGFFKKNKVPEKNEDSTKIYLDWDFSLFKTLKIANSTNTEEISDKMKYLLKISKKTKDFSLLLVINDNKTKRIISRKFNYFEYPFNKLDDDYKEFNHIETSLIFTNVKKHTNLERVNNPNSYNSNLNLMKMIDSSIKKK